MKFGRILLGLGLSAAVLLAIIGERLAYAILPGEDSPRATLPQTEADICRGANP